MNIFSSFTTYKRKPHKGSRYLIHRVSHMDCTFDIANIITRVYGKRSQIYCYRPGIPWLWWYHGMETLSALLALYGGWGWGGIPWVTGRSPLQRAGAESGIRVRNDEFHVFCAIICWTDSRVCRWFETTERSSETIQCSERGITD